MKTVATAQAELNAIIAKQRIQSASTNEIPPPADGQYKLEEEILVYSKQEKRGKVSTLYLTVQDDLSQPKKILGPKEKHVMLFK